MLFLLPAMAAKLKLRFTGKKGAFFPPLTGKILLDGNFEIDAETKKPFLTVGCVSVGEMEGEVNRIKKQLDEIVTRAKRRLPK